MSHKSFQGKTNIICDNCTWLVVYWFCGPGDLVSYVRVI